MTKSEIKQELFHVIRRKQLEIIDNLKIAMDDTQKAANEYGAPRDRYDSFRAQVMRKRDMYAKQLHLALEQMTVLDKISFENLNDIVEFGAVVITDKQNLFVSISMGKLVQDDKTYYAISSNVPIFQALDGKRAGEDAIFNGVQIHILDVF